MAVRTYCYPESLTALALNFKLNLKVGGVTDPLGPHRQFVHPPRPPKISNNSPIKIPFSSTTKCHPLFSKPDTRQAAGLDKPWFEALEVPAPAAPEPQAAPVNPPTAQMPPLQGSHQQPAHHQRRRQRQRQRLEGPGVVPAAQLAAQVPRPRAFDRKMFEETKPSEKRLCAKKRGRTV